MSLIWKSRLIISSQLYLESSPIESLLHYAWDHVYYVQVIYSQIEISNPFYVIYFMPAWFEGWQICVDTTLIIGFTYVVCKHDGIIGRVDADMWSLSTVQIVIASQKVREKASGLPHMFDQVFRNVERYKLVHVRNRCRIVWVVSMYTCHSQWIFSVFRLQPLFAFMSSTTVSWINCCASEHFLNPVRLPLGGPWWQADRGMALTAVE